MEMTYNGTLTMPANFAALDEEEMTYVEGGYSDSGTKYCSSGMNLYHWFSTCSNVVKAFAIVECISGTVAGAIAGYLVGNLPGAIIGGMICAAAGFITGTCLMQWSQTLSTAAVAAHQIGNRECHYRVIEHQWTLTINVW